MAQVTVNNVTVFFDKILIAPGYSSDPAAATYYTTNIRVTNQNNFDVVIEELFTYRAIDTTGSVYYRVWKQDELHFPSPATIPANAVEFPVELTGPGMEGDYTEENSSEGIVGRLTFTEWGYGGKLDAAFDIIEWGLPPAEPQNTGYKAWTTLEEYYLDSGQPTGNTKPNDPADPDYVAPVYDTVTCPLP